MPEKVEGSDFDRLGDLLPDGEAVPRARSRRSATGGAGVAGNPPVSGTTPFESNAGSPGGIPPSGAGAGEADLNQRVAGLWLEVVGPEVAANARPVQVREGRLVATTSSSAWAQTLQLMSEMVIARLNDRLGGPVIEKAVFRHAGWLDFARRDVPEEPKPRRAAGSSDKAEQEGLSVEERQALADLEGLPLSPSAKDAIRNAMKAGFVRARQDSGRS
jgi:hypothetical protein